MAWLEIFNFLHFLGTAFGLGGATIAAIVSSKAAKDKELGKQVGKIMAPVVKIIWTGLVLLIISGIAITILVTWPINRQMLIIKHVLVAWMVIIGVFLGTRMNKIKKLSNEKNSQDKIALIQKQIGLLSKINLFLWYLVTLLSAFV